MSPRLLRAPRPAIAAAALLLAGCQAPGTQFAPACPQLSLLQDAGDLTRFAGPPGAPRDARSLAYAARITAVPAHCANAGPGEVRATLHVVAQLRRGPAASGSTVRVPYFVALTEGEQVLGEQDFALAVTFQNNVDRASANGEDIQVTLPVSKTKTAAAYHIYVGFRLTPDELAYNRQAARTE
jgi:hypothetical protein